MIRIDTERLIIRNFNHNDWEDLLEIIEDKESSEYAVYDHQFPTSANKVRQITDWFAHVDDYLAVYEPEVTKVIGYVAINEEAPAAKNLGYNLHSEYHRRGYAYEACTAVINHAFKTMDIERFTSGTANQNYPSYKLLLKLGFKKTGESMESFRKTPQGEPIEFMGSLFELKKEEWETLDYSSG